MVDVSLQPWTGGFDFSFEREGQQVTLSASASYAWRDQNLVTQPQRFAPDVSRWLDRELVPWLRSDASFRDEGIAGMQRLEHVVDGAIRDHSLHTCDRPNAPDRFRYVQTAGGEGAFDTCVHRPLTRAEMRELRADAGRVIGARTAFIRLHHRAMRRALLDTVPLDRCWPALSP